MTITKKETETKPRTKNEGKPKAKHKKPDENSGKKSVGKPGRKDQELDMRLVPEINIGMVGHVDHGKTTLTSALTGKWTDTHSEEIRRGITIRLGYADTTIYKCRKCKEPQCYGTTSKCVSCFGDCDPLRTVSFVDAPGHEMLMITVLSGTALMNGALLIISADEKCPQPQTQEHLTALNIVGIKNIIIVQNKIDMVSADEARSNYKDIKAFVNGTVAEKAPIIPVSAQQRINIDALLEAIEKNMPTPERDLNKDPKMLIARSFDTNKPGTDISKLKGGVIGGSLIQGVLGVGDIIEIRPGIRRGDGPYQEITTKIIGIQKAMKDMNEAGAGGLLGLSTELDPCLAKSDALSGSVAGLPGKVPPVITELKLDTNLLDRVIGTKDGMEVTPIRIGETLMITVGISRTVGSVVSASKGQAIMKLKLPISADKGERAAISRQVAGRWRLIGWGSVS